MSNELMTRIGTAVVSIKDRFISYNDSNGNVVDFNRECQFARQQIMKNDYIQKIANSNLESLQSAILNVAAIGISLNPATSHAYLVPRKGAICLDISFRGLVKIATDCGAIKWAKTELVYKNDKFKWLGVYTPPEHEADPFSDRGEIVGGYCVAKLPDEYYMIETMSLEDIHHIRGRSETFKVNSGPWVTDEPEMIKKTITRRAYKSWPQTTNRMRLDAAINAVNQADGIAYTLEEHADFMACISKHDALSFHFLRNNLNQDTYIALYNSGNKGEKMKLKQICDDLERDGHAAFSEMIETITNSLASGENYAALEILAEMDDAKLDFTIKSLESEFSNAALNLLEENK